MLYTCAGVKVDQGVVWERMKICSETLVQVPASTCTSPMSVLRYKVSEHIFTVEHFIQ